MQRGTALPTLVMTDLDEGFKYIADPVLDTGEVKIPDSSTGIFFGNRVFIPYNRDSVFPSNLLDYTVGPSTFAEFRVNQGSAENSVSPIVTGTRTRDGVRTGASAGPTR